MATRSADIHPAKDIPRAELVVLLASMMALQALSIDAMLPALPLIAADLGVTDANSRQLVVGVYLLASGLGALFPGALADRFGRRPVALGALAAYVAMALGCALVTDFDVLLALRMGQGLLSAGIIVVPAAIIRDRFEGDRMARLMSLVFAVFITVPIIAPSLGQAVLWFAHWRAIFVMLAVSGAMTGLWFYLRMPESLHPEFRQPIEPRALLGHMRDAVLRRESFGYVVGGSLVTSSIFGYVNSSQQLVGEHFGAGEYFPLVFGATAATLILSNLTNARIVERFGARRVSHCGLLVFIAMSTAQVWFAVGSWQSLAWFIPLMGANLAVVGFLTSNFGSIAMQPFAATAGAASSVQTFVRMFVGGLGGILIGQAYDGTSMPLAVALLAIGCSALALVLYSERGRLFRRLYKGPRPIGQVL